MSIGSTRPLMDALRLACADMVNWLSDDYGYDKMDAYQLLGQTAVIKIANVVDPQYSVACAVDKKIPPEEIALGQSGAVRHTSLAFRGTRKIAYRDRLRRVRTDG